MESQEISRINQRQVDGENIGEAHLIRVRREHDGNFLILPYAKILGEICGAHQDVPVSWCGQVGFGWDFTTEEFIFDFNIGGFY